MIRRPRSTAPPTVLPRAIREKIDLCQRIDAKVEEIRSRLPLSSICDVVKNYDEKKDTGILAKAKEATGLNNLTYADILNPGAAVGERLVPYPQDGVTYRISESFCLVLVENKLTKCFTQGIENFNYLLAADHYHKLCQANKYSEALVFFESKFFPLYVRDDHVLTGFLDSNDIINVDSGRLDQLEALRDELVTKQWYDRNSVKLKSIDIGQKLRDGGSMEELKAFSEELKEGVDSLMDQIDQYERKTKVSSKVQQKMNNTNNNETYWV